MVFSTLIMDDTRAPGGKGWSLRISHIIVYGLNESSPGLPNSPKSTDKESSPSTADIHKLAPG